MKISVLETRAGVIVATATSREEAFEMMKEYETTNFEGQYLTVGKGPQDLKEYPVEKKQIICHFTD